MGDGVRRRGAGGGVSDGTITTGDTRGKLLRRARTLDEAHLFASKLARGGIDSSICRDIQAAARGEKSFLVRVQPVETRR
jgi:hypothetical protein